MDILPELKVDQSNLVTTDLIENQQYEKNLLPPPPNLPRSEWINANIGKDFYGKTIQYASNNIIPNNDE